MISFRNRKIENFQDLGSSVLHSYKKVGRRMSLKIINWDFFSDNLGVSKVKDSWSAKTIDLLKKLNLAQATDQNLKFVKQ